MYIELAKVIKTLESCQTESHFKVALNMFNNWRKMYIPPFKSDVNFVIDNETEIHLNRIANKFNYEFRRAWGLFIHRADAIQESE